MTTFFQNPLGLLTLAHIKQQAILGRAFRSVAKESLTTVTSAVEACCCAHTCQFWGSALHSNKINTQWRKAMLQRGKSGQKQPTTSRHTGTPTCARQTAASWGRPLNMWALSASESLQMWSQLKDLCNVCRYSYFQPWRCVVQLHYLRGISFLLLQFKVLRIKRRNWC